MPVIVPSSALGPIPGASGGATQNHLVYAAYSGRWWFFTWGGVLDSGTATGAGQSTAGLQDTSKSWTSSAFLGASCVLTGGTGVGEVFEIGPNTSNTLPFQNNGSPSPPQAGLATAPVSGSTTYQIVETRKVQAYVSSGPDLSTATWALATGAATPAIPNSTGIDMSGGSNDAGREGEFPTDGRLFSVGYAPINGVDVVMLLAQENLHWQHISCRGRLGVGDPATVVWDVTGPSTWEDRFPGNECPPLSLQALAIAASNTGRWHSIQTQNTFDIVGYPSTVIDTGLASMPLAWGGTRVSFDTGIPNLPWQGALAQLDAGLMLAVYGNGTYTGTFGANQTHQTGLRFAVSSSESLWPVTNVGASIPGLSSASQHPNDWGMAGVNLNAVHVVRRNAATTIEHVVWAGSWSSVDTLPSSGLTGHFQGSGLPLVTDGVNLWLLAIDTDASNSVRYIKWTPSGGWDAAWSTLPTGTETKHFLTASIRADFKQIGVAWTTPNSTGFSGPPAYQVNFGSLALPDPAPVGGVAFTDPALSPQLLPGSPYAYMLWRPALVETGLRAPAAFQLSMSAALGPAGTRAGAVSKGLASAGLGLSGGQSRQAGKAGSGGLSFSGSGSRAASKGVAAAVSFAGSATRALAKGALTAALSLSGSLASGHLVIKALAGALSLAGAQARGVQRAAAGGLSFSGGQARSLAKLIGAGASFAGSRAVAVSRALGAAGLGFAGAAGRSMARPLAAGVSFAGGGPARAVQKSASALLSLAGARAASLGKAVGGGLSFAGSMGRRLPKALGAALSLTGGLATSFLLGGSHVAASIVNFVFRDGRLNWIFRR